MLKMVQICEALQKSIRPAIPLHICHIHEHYVDSDFSGVAMGARGAAAPDTTFRGGRQIDITHKKTDDRPTDYFLYHAESIGSVVSRHTCTLLKMDCQASKTPKTRELSGPTPQGPPPGSLVGHIIISYSFVHSQPQYLRRALRAIHHILFVHLQSSILHDWQYASRAQPVKISHSVVHSQLQNLRRAKRAMHPYTVCTFRAQYSLICNKLRVHIIIS